MSWAKEQGFHRLTKAGLAPVLSNVGQVVANNGPHIVDRIALVSIVLLQSVSAHRF